MKPSRWVALIFLITLALRLFLAFQAPHFTYDSYFHLRHVEHITDNFLPLFEDPLSYGSRTIHFLPLFHYLAALFALLIPLELVGKLLPNMLVASLIPIVYLITTKTTKIPTARILASGVAGFLPILYNTNSFTPISLFLPLIFLSIFFFLKIEENYTPFLITLLAACFTSSATFLIIIGLAIYFLLSLLEKKKIDKAELEIALFSLFFFLWTQLIFFKDRLFEEGTRVIWQNIPTQIVTQYFPQISILQSILLVSLIPFILGVFVVYRALFSLKKQKTFFLISLVISTTLLTWFRLIKFEHSLAFFAIILSILTATFYDDLYKYLKTTKLARFTTLTTILLICSLALTMIYPAVVTSLSQDTATSSEVEAVTWLKENTPQDKVTLTSLKEGHLLTYYAKHKNVMDTQFSLIPDIETRFEDLNTVFTSSFQTQAIEILEKYDITYIMLTKPTKNQYQISKLNFLSSECFKQVYNNNDTRIYQRKCQLT